MTEPDYDELGTAPVNDNDPRPVVVTGIDIHRVLDDLDEALGHTDPLLFQRSNELVIVVGTSEDDAPDPRRQAPALRAVVPASLLPRVTRYVSFQRRVKPDKMELTAAKLENREPRWSAQACVPPPVVLSAFIHKPSWNHIRRIRGISGCPFMRADGSIVQTPGYDPRTQYLYQPNADFPPVPEEPTQADAAAALSELRDVFADFPHVGESDRMVPVAAAMTVIARPSLSGATPAFIFDASTRGSGKTLQCDVVAAIATGQKADRTSFPEDDTELDKTLCSHAISGFPILLLDNVTRMFGGGPLDKVITASGNVSFRKLSSMDILSVPWTATIMASGNGISFHEDTARRVLVSRLESPLENPEARTEGEFRHADLLGWVLANRPRLVCAALTILRAYALKGFPDAGCPRWGSFEEWARLIPHAIVFAGGADPMLSRPTVDGGGGSADADYLGVILSGMLFMYRTQYASAQEFAARLFGPEGSSDPKLSYVRDAVRAVTRWKAGRDVDTNALSYYLRGKRGRVIAGKKLEKEPPGSKHKGVVRWRVVDLNPAARGMGDGGYESDPPNASLTM